MAGRPGLKNARRYSEDEKIAALELAATIGVTAAANQLDVGRKTMYQWQQTHPELWSDLTKGAREAQKHGFASRLEDLAENYVELEFEALQRAAKLIKTSDAKETAALIKSMGASRGLATLGARQTRGEDAERVEVDINFPQIEQALERILQTAPEPPALQVTNEAEHEHQRT